MIRYMQWAFPEKNCTPHVGNTNFFEVDPLDFQSVFYDPLEFFIFCINPLEIHVFPSNSLNTWNKTLKIPHFVVDKRSTLQQALHYHYHLKASKR